MPYFAGDVTGSNRALKLQSFVVLNYRNANILSRVVNEPVNKRVFGMPHGIDQYICVEHVHFHILRLCLSRYSIGVRCGFG